MNAVRPAAVAGMFYPADPRQLASEIRALLSAARMQGLEHGDHGDNLAPVDETRHGRFPLPNPPPVGEGTNASLREFKVKALIVPHAGYIYSGAIAASAYSTLTDIASRICRVLLLGPTHRVAVNGIALPDTSAFETPLGKVMLDVPAMSSITNLPQVIISDAAHALEHSLEVQLPFLQCVLDDFTLLPLAVGHATAQEVAEVLETVWGGDETLIVISSDLSHYLPYADAQQADAITANNILRLNQPITHEQACGGTPINGLIIAARAHHLTPHLLDLRNSGDTAGSHDRVVGYAAFVFTGENTHAHP